MLIFNMLVVCLAVSLVVIIINSNDLVLKIVMDCQTVAVCRFRGRWGFTSHDVIDIKEVAISTAITDAFKGENKQWNCSLGYNIDHYFHDCKLAKEVDEYRRFDRNTDYEIKRWKAIEEQLGCEFVRNNSDGDSLNIFKVIYNKHSHIKKSSREFLMDKISKKKIRIKIPIKSFIKIKTSKVCCL